MSYKKLSQTKKTVIILLNHKTIGKNPSCLSPDFRNVRMPSRDCAKISKRQFANRFVAILSRHITIRSLLKCSHTRFFFHITKRLFVILHTQTYSDFFLCLFHFLDFDLQTFEKVMQNGQPQPSTICTSMTVYTSLLLN